MCLPQPMSQHVWGFYYLLAHLLLFIYYHHEHCCFLIASLVHVRSANLLLLFCCRCKSPNKTAVLYFSLELWDRFSTLNRQLMWSAHPAASATLTSTVIFTRLFHSEPPNSHTLSHIHTQACLILSCMTFTSETDITFSVMSIVGITGGPLRKLSPNGDIVLSAMLPCPSAVSWDDSR